LHNNAAISFVANPATPDTLFYINRFDTNGQLLSRKVLSGYSTTTFPTRVDAWNDTLWRSESHELDSSCILTAYDMKTGIKLFSKTIKYASSLKRSLVYVGKSGMFLVSNDDFGKCTFHKINANGDSLNSVMYQLPPFQNNFYVDSDGLYFNTLHNFGGLSVREPYVAYKVKSPFLTIDSVLVPNPANLSLGTGFRFGPESLFFADSCQGGACKTNLIDDSYFGSIKQYTIPISTSLSVEYTMDAIHIGRENFISIMEKGTGQKSYCHLIKIPSWWPQKVTITDNNLFKVFPNPTNDQVTIWAKAGNTQYELIDSKGLLIQQGIAKEVGFKLETDKLPSGIYFIHLINNNSQITQKLIKL